MPLPVINNTNTNTKWQNWINIVAFEANTVIDRYGLTLSLHLDRSVIDRGVMSTNL